MPGARLPGQAAITALRAHRLPQRGLVADDRGEPEPGKAAENAGREWGACLTEQPPPHQKLTAEEAVGKLTAIMEEPGFSPQPEAGDGQYRLHLLQRPFREVAQHHQDVICSLHLGPMRGRVGADGRTGHRGPAGTVRRAQPVRR